MLGPPGFGMLRVPVVSQRHGTQKPRNLIRIGRPALRRFLEAAQDQGIEAHRNFVLVK